MKELTSYNRAAGYLNKLFDLLNAEFFESALSRPTITIQSTPKAYGHFSLRDDTWISKNGATHEINIGAGTLSRPIEEVAATLLPIVAVFILFNLLTRSFKNTGRKPRQYISQQALQGLSRSSRSNRRAQREIRLVAHRSE